MTDKQKQNLLAYLGYYRGAIDGIFGKKSKAGLQAFLGDFGLAPDSGDTATENALKHAVANGMPPKKDFWEEIRYFQPEEFRCKCGGKYCDGFPAQPEKTLVVLAERVRSHFGAPVIVSSGVRCVTHNANVGGASASRHMAGKAMDFTVKGRKASDVLAFVKQQPEVRYAYAIDGSYIHMDIS